MLIVNLNTELFTPGSNKMPFGGMFKDFSARWYTTIGASILLTMGLNIVTPNIAPLMKYILRQCKICSDRGCGFNTKQSKKLTQNDYNMLVIGPGWMIADRYGQLLNVIFMTFIFSSFMPILYWFAAANFVIVYWVDKLVFLRLHCTPPSMDEELAKSVSALLPLTAVFHLAFTAWAFSNPVILMKQGSGAVESSDLFAEMSMKAGESKGFFQVLLV